MTTASAHTELLTTWTAETSITREEKIDMDALSHLLTLVDDLPREDIARLKTIKKGISKGCWFSATYKLGKQMKSAEEMLGRLCVVKGIGLQALPSDQRAYLARANYTDVDIVSAHPTLMLQLCERKGLVCEEQRKFLTSRTEYFKALCDTLDCDRDFAKKKINALYFGFPSAVEGLPEMFVPLHKEILCAREVLVTSEEWAKHLKFLNGKDNRLGKGLSFILQTTERSCLIALDKAARVAGRSMDVLIHDGGLIRKVEGETDFPVELLRAFEKSIEADTTFKVKLSLKPMITSFVRDGNVETYAEFKTRFEKEHFQLKSPACYVRIFEKKIGFFGPEAMAINHKGDEMYGEWTMDKYRRTYEAIEFAPGIPLPAHTFNLFTGFPTEAVSGDISVVQDVLRLICNGDQASFDFVENYFAHLFQKPSEKPGVAIVVTGDEGVGKDSYGDFIGSMLGEEMYLNTENPESNVFCRFTSHLARCLFIKFEEADFETNATNKGQLKSFITKKSSICEEKGVKAITLNSFWRVMMTSNEFAPVVLSDTNRRFFMMRASNEKRGDLEFWDRVHNAPNGLSKQATRQAYMDYLMKKDISHFNPRKFPRTDYLEEATQLFIPQHAKFFQRKVEAVLALSDNATEDVEYVARDLFNKINESVKYPTTETKFGRDMRMYVEAGVLTKTKSGTIKYSFDAVGMRDYLMQRRWWVEL